jgi:hypothetical protein
MVRCVNAMQAYPRTADPNVYAGDHVCLAASVLDGKACFPLVSGSSLRHAAIMRNTAAMQEVAVHAHAELIAKDLGQPTTDVAFQWGYKVSLQVHACIA